MGATRIKVCGITRTRDAEAAAEAGVDALGFVFYPGSPRYVSPAGAAAISGRLPPFLTRVGLFVNASLDEIRRTVELGFLHALQLHGDESTGFCRQLRSAVGGLPIIKALRVGVCEDLHAVAQWPVQAVLLDAKVSNQYGGTGHSFDWSLLDAWPQRFVEGEAVLPMVLAGGLTPESVALAVAQVQPYAVDVSSGVESAPGIKCIHKIRAFVQQVRQTDCDWNRPGTAREEHDNT
ncbi:MAG: phosphoribosylanthranilate isomerase [Magnetococcus sp. MYC-9]